MRRARAKKPHWASSKPLVPTPPPNRHAVRSHPHGHSPHRTDGLRQRKRLPILIMVVLILGVPPCASPTAKNTPDNAVVVVSGPTLIGFFPKVNQREVDEDQDLAEILSDFQYHLGRAREHLERRGVSVYELYTAEIRIHEAGAVRTFVPDSDRVNLGVYLVSPGQEPQILYGVMTDVDLLMAAHLYFGLPEFGRGE